MENYPPVLFAVWAMRFRASVRKMSVHANMVSSVSEWRSERIWSCPLALCMCFNGPSLYCIASSSLQGRDWEVEVGFDFFEEEDMETTDTLATEK